MFMKSTTKNQKNEEKYVFIKKFLSDYADDEATFKYLIEGEKLTFMAISAIFCNAEKNNYSVDSIIINPILYSEIRNWRNTIYLEYDHHTILKSHAFGMLWTSEIYVSNKIPKDKIVVADSFTKRAIINEISFRNIEKYSDLIKII